MALMESDSDTLEFKRGYMLACCNLVNMHDEPTIGAEVLAAADITKADVKAMDLTDYDATALREMRKYGRFDPIKK